MKGAIGNAFILNTVITFIIIFFTLLIGSMAFSKAYKTKNFLINKLEQFELEGKKNIDMPYTQDRKDWDEQVNEYLSKVGYPIATKNGSCEAISGYAKWIYSKTGQYDYCIYRKYHVHDTDKNPLMHRSYNYIVRVYMKLDFPIIGEYAKIPITGESKTYYMLK